MYKIVGADNKVYGPVSQEEVLQWIAAGRANARTIARLEDGPWKPLATFEEFKAALNIPAGAPIPTSDFTTVPPPQPVPGAMAGAQANATAITGLVFGILGVCCCPLIGPLLAIVLGWIGLNQIKSKPGAYTTDPSLAKVAIILGVVGLLIQCGFQIFGGGVGALEHLIKSR